MKEIKRSEFDRKLQAAKDDIAKSNGMQSVAVDWLVSVCELLRYNNIIITRDEIVSVKSSAPDNRTVVKLGPLNSAAAVDVCCTIERWSV